MDSTVFVLQLSPDVDQTLILLWEALCLIVIDGDKSTGGFSDCKPGNTWPTERMLLIYRVCHVFLGTYCSFDLLCSTYPTVSLEDDACHDGIVWTVRRSPLPAMALRTAPGCVNVCLPRLEKLLILGPTSHFPTCRRNKHSWMAYQVKNNHSCCTISFSNRHRQLQYVHNTEHQSQTGKVADLQADYIHCTLLPCKLNY